MVSVSKLLLDARHMPLNISATYQLPTTHGNSEEYSEGSFQVSI